MILPENRTILDFKEAGNVFTSGTGLEIKNYGLLDGSHKPQKEPKSVEKSAKSSPKSGNSVAERKVSTTGQESGYGSDGTSSRASPRSGSFEEENGHSGNPAAPNNAAQEIQSGNTSSVRDKIRAFQRQNTPSPPNLTCSKPVLLPKPSSNLPP